MRLLWRRFYALACALHWGAYGGQSPPDPQCGIPCEAVGGPAECVCLPAVFELWSDAGNLVDTFPTLAQARAASDPSDVGITAVANGNIVGVESVANATRPKMGHVLSDDRG